MTSLAFLSSFPGAHVGSRPSRLVRKDACCGRYSVAGISMAADQKGKGKGFFGKLKETIMRPIVTVPGGGQGGDLLECVFCKGSGINDCDACKGSGKDALGTCFMCEGKTSIKCTVCEGVGTVDRIRRGGTDDRNEYVVNRKKR